jgi:8-oxo-dGTP diphosphatase
VNIQVVTAVIEREDRRILIGQRRRGDSSPYKWEFPGGKVKPGESPEQALARELREELDVTLQRCVPICTVQHEYGGGAGLLSITFFAASILESELKPAAFEQVMWILPRELANYDFLAANRRLVAQLATGRIKAAQMLAASTAEASSDGD